MVKVIKLKPVFEDVRGKITDILTDGEYVRHTGLITSKAGVKRGNHYHERSMEYLYILRGKLRWISKDLSKKDSPVEDTILEEGDLLINPPKTAHALVMITDTEILEMSTLPRTGKEYEKDTKPYKLIDK
ncbi:MAG: cupin domain-containing protein [Patescibacteria group bacterium]|nr:cupin domain-containing protein [Patescibacteria group bacterium]MDE2015244.1 cupin domain-containing protein [Patescibacteria group bacterium]MDE2227050.1 cupin domain-containing protein [Patescibacteria group bacterium]